ncbi:hypothetical protein RhiTH_011654 [Rhizoctonia solani]
MAGTGVEMQMEQELPAAEEQPAKQPRVAIEEVDDKALHVVPPPRLPNPGLSTQEQAWRQSRWWKGMYVEEFNDILAGAPISTTLAPKPDLKAHIKSTGVFASPRSFEIAKLLMTTGLTDSAKEQHLQSVMFTINKINATSMPCLKPQFLVHWNTLDLLRELFSNKAFNSHFVYAPTRYWTTRRKKEQVFVDMRLGNWWWREQEKLMKAGKRNTTIAAVILLSDKTNLSVMSGGQTAYPVYITVANIDKDWQQKPSKRTTLLLGYLPTDLFEDVENNNKRRRLKAKLVHCSMEVMLALLKEAMEDGEGQGDLDTPLDLRNCKETLDALQAYFDNRGTEILNTLGLKPVWLWWGDMKGVDLHKSIPPNMLHQLYQGIFKLHMAKWLKLFIGANKLDKHFAAMPRAEGLRHFPKGISVVKQWTGKESKEMLQQILPAVLGNLQPNKAQMIRSLVDFIFQAHMSSMTETDLGHLEHKLDMFHQFKEVLVARDYYQSSARFNCIPKLHVLSHYVDLIWEFGTPNGYSTKVPKHLHIEYAKIPWCASNKVQPVTTQLGPMVHRGLKSVALSPMDYDNKRGNKGPRSMVMG